MKNLEKSKEFLRKAQDFLNWSNDAYQEMQEYGKHANIDAIRRTFFSLLTFVGSMHDALDAAANKAAEQEWRNALNESRKTDPLLNYFWAARNIDVHDRLLAWDPHLAQFTIEIVDVKKVENLSGRYPFVQNNYMRVWCFIFNVSSENEVVKKFCRGKVPDKERMALAGVQLVQSLHSLALVSFDYTPSKEKRRRFDPPPTHQGKALEKSVNAAITAILGFYLSKITELSLMIYSGSAMSYSFSVPVRS